MAHKMPFVAAQIAGKKFGRLTVLTRNSTQAKKRGTEVLWRCRCECGREIDATTNRLTSGTTRSCGCLRDEIVAAGTRKTHGKSSTRTYNIWTGMLTRCLNVGSDRYEYYGARGISVCKRWLRFESFLCDMGEPPEGWSLDRIDPDGNYTPKNCRWASRQRQMRNQRRTVWITVDIRSMAAPDWAEIIGVKTATLNYRIRKGWTAERAIGIAGARYGR